MIWLITGINIRGVADAAATQLVMTVLKIFPLLMIIGLALFTGDAANIPEFNPPRSGRLTRRSPQPRC